MDARPQLADLGWRGSHGSQARRHERRLAMPSQRVAQWPDGRTVVLRCSVPGGAVVLCATAHRTLRVFGAAIVWFVVPRAPFAMRLAFLGVPG